MWQCQAAPLLWLQVTRLEVHIRCVLPGGFYRYKETVLVILACIVVACSARLEALDLRLDWYYRDFCVEYLLVSPHWRVCNVNSLLRPLPRRKVAYASVSTPWQGAAALCRQLQSLRLGLQRASGLGWASDSPPRSPLWTQEGEDAYRELEFSDPWTLVAVKR